MQSCSLLTVAFSLYLTQPTACNSTAHFPISEVTWVNRSPTSQGCWAGEPPAEPLGLDSRCEVFPFVFRQLLSLWPVSPRGTPVTYNGSVIASLQVLNRISSQWPSQGRRNWTGLALAFELMAAHCPLQSDQSLIWWFSLQKLLIKRWIL